MLSRYRNATLIERARAAPQDWWYCPNFSDDEAEACPASSLPKVLGMTLPNFVRHAQSENVFVGQTHADGRRTFGRTPDGFTKATGSNGKSSVTGANLIVYCIGEQPPWAPTVQLGRGAGRTAIEPPAELLAVLADHAFTAPRDTQEEKKEEEEEEKEEDEEEEEENEKAESASDDEEEEEEEQTGALSTAQRRLGRAPRQRLPTVYEYETGQTGPLNPLEKRVF